MKPSQLALLRQLALNSPSRCHHCHQRLLHSTPILLDDKPSPGHLYDYLQSLEPRKAGGPYIPKVGVTNRDPSWKPTPLGRPIGWPKPPHPADNLDVDLRTFEQKREDFRDWDKHIEQRKHLFKTFARPYFRDYTFMKYAKGKMWVANPRLWKKEMSLWMPNFWGRDLRGEAQSSAMICQGKVTVVAVMSRQWAADQVKTFVDEEVRGVIRGSDGRAQMLEIHVEDKPLFRAVMWLFRGRMRKLLSQEWQRYLQLNEVKDELREVLGMINRLTGYVYLLDSDSRIRWAGSGDAEPEEKAALISGLRKLIDEKASVKTEKKTTAVLPQPVITKAPQEQAAAAA
jgi:ATPase complex subunit ATP10